MNMQSKVALIGFMAIGVLLSGTSSLLADESDLDKALAQSRETGKPVLVYVYDSIRQKFCRGLDKDPTANREFVKFGEKYILHVDDSLDGESALAQKYELPGNATYFLLLNSAGKEIGRAQSFPSIEFGNDVLNRIKDMHQDDKAKKLRARAEKLRAKAKALEARAKELEAKTQSTISHGVEVFLDVTVKELQTGTRIAYGGGFHQFVDIPEYLQGRSYTDRHGYQGILRFRVLEEQTIHMALYGGEWGVGGNPSGGWQEEVIAREDLEKQGWRETTLLRVIHSNPDYAEQPSWIVFTRECKPGESFAIRNHKYQAPVLIWGPNG